MWGDCGAFAYVEEHEPPYSVDEIVDFTLMENSPMVTQLITLYSNTRKLNLTLRLMILR